MRLDADVLRDVLLHLEKNLKIEISEEYGEVESNSIDPQEIYINEKFKNHNRAMILYAVRMLSEGGLINPCVEVGARGDWHFSEIYDITFAGHEFIETIRNAATWGKTKEIAKKTGCQAVSFLGQVASAVVLEVIKGGV